MKKPEATPNVSMPVLQGPTQVTHLLTGPGSPQRTDTRWGITGTDLGIAFNAPDGDTVMAFGDTVSCHGEGQGWRSNTMVRTSDADYTDGLQLESAWRSGRWADKGTAGQFIPSLKIPGVEHTTIPTSGISVGDAMYVDYMSVRSWDTPGNWSTNYAATMKSTDDGRTWELVPESVRVNDKPARDALKTIGLGGVASQVTSGNENVQMTSLIHGGQGETEAGYLYRLSTPSGRFGPAVLSRVAVKDFPNESAFEFFDGRGWTRSAAKAKPVIEAPVSEISVQYNDYLDTFVVTYLEEGKGLVMQTADDLAGPWSERRLLVSTQTMPGIYGAFQLPANNGKDLYYVATTWSEYNVYVMRTDLSELFDRATSTDDATEVVDHVDYSARTAVRSMPTPEEVERATQESLEAGDPSQ